MYSQIHLHLIRFRSVSTFQFKTCTWIILVHPHSKCSQWKQVNTITIFYNIQVSISGADIAVLALDHIHFASPPYTSERAKLKVKALAQLITPYTGSTNLFVVPYTKPQEYIRDNAPDVLFTVLMRRSMMRIANIIARKQGCEALVTGESLAQVASQTVKALQCTDAAQDLPILRPLIGMDKTEIVETARHINTFETSILPYEDCCTIFTPPHPKIRPELSEILEAEAGMPGLAELEAEAAETTERIRLRITDDVEFEG